MQMRTVGSRWSQSDRGKLTKQVGRRSDEGPRSALCNGENHIPKYFLLVVTSVCPSAETKRTTNARSSRGISTPTRRGETCLRSSPEVVSGWLISHIESSVHRDEFRGRGRMAERAVSGSGFCGLPVENRWVRSRITNRLINRGWRSLIDNDLHYVSAG